MESWVKLHTHRNRQIESPKEIIKVVVQQFKNHIIGLKHHRHFKNKHIMMVVTWL